MTVNWNRYTPQLDGATATEKQLLRQVAQGAVIDVSKLNSGKLVSLVTKAGFTVSVVLARNIVLDKYLKGIRRLRKTKLGHFFGQKVIVNAK